LTLKILLDPREANPSSADHVISHKELKKVRRLPKQPGHWSPKFPMHFFDPIFQVTVGDMGRILRKIYGGNLMVARPSKCPVMLINFDLKQCLELS